MKSDEYSQFVNGNNLHHSQYGWTVFSSGQDELATIEDSKKWSEHDLQFVGCSVDSNEDISGFCTLHI